MDVGQIGGNNLVYIVELNVKLETKRTNIVEMRAKSVWLITAVSVGCEIKTFDFHWFSVPEYNFVNFYMKSSFLGL